MGGEEEERWNVGGGEEVECGRGRRGGMWEGEERWNVGGKGEALSLIKKLRHVQFGGQGKAACMWGGKGMLDTNSAGIAGMQGGYKEVKYPTQRHAVGTLYQVPHTEARSGHTLSSTPHRGTQWAHSGHTLSSTPHRGTKRAQSGHTLSSTPH